MTLAAHTSVDHQVLSWIAWERSKKVRIKPPTDAEILAMWKIGNDTKHIADYYELPEPHVELRLWAVLNHYGEAWKQAGAA